MLFEVTELAPPGGKGFLRLLAKFEGLFIGRQAGFTQRGFRFARHFFLQRFFLRGARSVKFALFPAKKQAAEQRAREKNEGAAPKCL